MAKIKPTKYPDRVWHGRGFNVRVVVSRVGPSRGFRACAYLGHKNVQRDRWASDGLCAYGKNPRVAAKRTLAKLGKRIGGRSGAFAGLDG